MPTKTKNANKLAKKITPAVNPLTALKQKFERLKELRNEINKMKVLYQEHDALMEELMPMFVTVTADEIVINREVVLGNKKYRVNPFFYDEQKATFKSKVWKSTAFNAVTVE